MFSFLSLLFRNIKQVKTLRALGTFYLKLALFLFRFAKLYIRSVDLIKSICKAWFEDVRLFEKDRRQVDWHNTHASTTDSMKLPSVWANF